jgi:signal transduction histidine kinase
VQVERIKRSARSLISTLGDTLAAFRSGETGDVEFSLRAGLDSVLEPLAVQAQSKGLRLAWSVGPDVPDRLRGDEDTLLQAVRNVVVHAVRAAVHGAVEVRVGSPAASSPDGVTLRFEIRSPAPGFPDNEPHPGHKGLGLPRAGALVHALGSTLLMTPGPDGSVSFSLRLQHA